MAFSVSQNHQVRSLGLYKSSGKHAAPKGTAPAPEPVGRERRSPAGPPTRMPRLTPHQHGRRREQAAYEAHCRWGTRRPPPHVETRAGVCLRWGRQHRGMSTFELSEEQRALREAVRALAESRSRHARRRSTGPRSPALGTGTIAGQGGLPRGPHPGVLRRRWRRCAGGGARHRGGRAGLRHLVADPRGEQARHHAAPARRVGGDQTALPGAGGAGRGDVLLRPVGAGGRLGRGRRCGPGRCGPTAGTARRRKRWITNAGVSKYWTVMAVTDPDNSATGISAFVVEDGDPGFTFGAPDTSSASRAHRPVSSISTAREIPADRLIGDEGRGVGSRAHPGPHRVTIASQAPDIAQGALGYAVGDVKERKQSAARSPSSRACSSCSPHGHGAGGRPGADLRRRGPLRGPDAREKVDDPTFFSSACQVPGLRRRDVGDNRRGPSPRRQRYVNDYPVERMIATPRSPRSSRAPTRSSAW